MKIDTRLQLRYDLFRYEVRKLIEKNQIKIAWALPKWLVMWATLRLIAHGTTGQYGMTTPSELDVMEALKRWDNHGS